MLRTVLATRYVGPFKEGGSLPGLVEADDDGLYVLKFRGAGQGLRALIAEVIGGEIGRYLGLPVPEAVLIDLDPAIGKAEPDFEIKALLDASAGLNYGSDFLPGALPYSPVLHQVDPEIAANIVWFDALITNVDRTPRNPNLLRWHKQLWLIDHGASLYIHHTWENPDEHARRPFSPIRQHVLITRAGSIRDAHDRLAPRLTDTVLREIVALVPDNWLVDEPNGRREEYVTYLRTRLESAAFVEEADAGRI